MAGFGQVPIKAIWDMLDACAPGWTARQGLHKWRVMWRDKTYPSLPRGEHGKTNPEIELGHVKKMIRHLEIDHDCARRHLPILRG